MQFFVYPKTCGLLSSKSTFIAIKANKSKREEKWINEIMPWKHLENYYGVFASQIEESESLISFTL